MKQTAMQEANEIFLKSRSDEFYGWFWNNRERLLELEMKQIVEAHGDKLKKSRKEFGRSSERIRNDFGKNSERIRNQYSRNL